VRLVWTRLAVADRDAIFMHIGAQNPSAAVQNDRTIETALGRLLEFPSSGRKGRVEGTRELVIAGTPYIAAYGVSPDRVLVLRILHGAQVWPDELDL